MKPIDLRTDHHCYIRRSFRSVTAHDAPGALGSVYPAPALAPDAPAYALAPTAAALGALDSVYAASAFAPSDSHSC